MFQNQVQARYSLIKKESVDTVLSNVTRRFFNMYREILK